MIPACERTKLVVALFASDDLAIGGDQEAGLAVLRSGAEEARRAMADGATWGEALVAQWERAVSHYNSRHREPILA